MKRNLVLLLILSILLHPCLVSAKSLFGSGGTQVVYRGTVTGLRISAVDGTAFLDNIDITAEEANGKVVASGSVTQANMRISGVDGTAFIDTADATFATNITGNLGKYLVIKDSAGKKIKGWIKAVGTGETLDTDVMAGFDFTSGWNAASATIDDSNSFTSSGNGGAYKTGVLTALCLYKYTYVSSTTATNSQLIAIATGVVSTPVIVSAGSTTGYGNTGTTLTGIYLRNSGAGTTDVTSLKAEQVLTPSTSGVTITNTKGGTTYNWYSKETGFNYNDSSNYTYQVIDRSLSAFADGNYGIEVYDSSGRMLKGVAKAVGTGETLDTELVANGDMETGDPPTGWNNADGASTLARESTIKNGGSYSLKITRGTSGASYQGITTAAGSLYKIIKNGYRSTAAGETATYLFGSTSAWDNQGWFGMMAVDTLDTWVNTTLYKTSPQNSLYIVVGVSGTTGNYGYIDDVSVQKVLTPSTAGITIVSAKGGTTYNWSYKNASFSYNSATNYVILKKLR